MGIIRWKFQIFCLATDIAMSETPRKLLELASVRCPQKFSKPVVRPLLDLQYNEFRTKVAKKFKYVDDEHSVMIFGNGLYKLMSEVMEIMKNESCCVILITKSVEEPCWTRNLSDPSLINPKRDYIFFNIYIGGTHTGYLIIEIFSDINPKISESFIQLFHGESISIGDYHVFKEGWFEFGIEPATLQDRGINHHPIMSHNRRGILSFSEDCDKGCDSFYLHFVPCTFFDEFRTVLGRVVHGDKILSQIQELETEFGKLDKELSIYSCGIIPVGCNKSEEIDEHDWIEAMYTLFGVPGPKEKSSNVLVDHTDGVSGADIVCPMFKPPEVGIDEEVDESSSAKSTDESVMTVAPWDEPLDIGTITFNYMGGATPKESEEIIDKKTEEIYSEEEVPKEATLFYVTSLVDLNVNISSLPEIELSEEDCKINPADEIHTISLGDIPEQPAELIKETLEDDQLNESTDTNLLVPEGKLVQIFPREPSITSEHIMEENEKETESLYSNQI